MERESYAAALSGPSATHKAARTAVVCDGATNAPSPAGAYLATLAPLSRQTMAGCAETIARIASRGTANALSFPWAQLSPVMVLALRAKLADAVAAGEWAPATANKHLACLRGILRAAWRLGQIDTDTYERCRDVPGVKGSRLPAGREVPHEERLALLMAGSSSPQATIRDDALVSLLYAGGLRRAEAVGLDLDDLDLDAATLIVRGKGDKMRLVPLPTRVLGALVAWRNERGDDPGPLFCRVDRWGTVHSQRRLGGEAVRQVLIRRAEKAGIPPARPHDLRRTYAGDLLDAGADLPVVSRLMGHVSVATTARYDRRGARAEREAVEWLVL
ncbi:MAG: tyrosine-type recombinase/integrase [Acidimicrobiales bacterium]